MKQGIKLHTINTNKFKTNLIAIFKKRKCNKKFTIGFCFKKRL